jgi:hypothetical protein
MVERREDGASKDVSPAAAADAANTDATTVLRLLREHVVHARVPVLPPQEPRQAAAGGRHLGPHHLCLAQPLRSSSEKPGRHPAKVQTCSGSEEASRQAWKKSWRKQGGICLRRGHFICFDAYQLRATVHLLSQRSGKFAVVFEISNLNSNGSSSYCLGVIRLYKVVKSLY